MLLFKNRESLHYNNSNKFKSSIISKFSGINNKKCDHSSFSKNNIFEPSFVQTMRKKQSIPRILTYKSSNSKTNILLAPVNLEAPNVVDFRKKNYTNIDFISKKENVDDEDKNRDMTVTEEEESIVDYYDIKEEDEEEEESLVPDYSNLVVGPTTIKELNTVLIEEKLTVIFFYTYWCKHCEFLDTYWNIMIYKNKSNIEFIKINNDYSAEITSKYDIKNVPTFLLLKRKTDAKIEIIATLTGVRIKELKNIILENE